MKFAHSIKQKTKVALLLFCIMVCLIMVRILEDKSIKKMNTSFISLYNDRLVPATDLFFIGENIFIKEAMLESYILSELSTEDQDNISKFLILTNKKIDSLLLKYEKTFLVKPEKKHLIELKNNIIASRIIEQQIVDIHTIENTTNSRSLFKLLKNTYNATFTKLSDLTLIQSKIGDELIKSSKSIISGSNFYSTIQFVLAIIIGVLIVSILFTSNVISIKNEKYNLN